MTILIDRTQAERVTWVEAREFNTIKMAADGLAYEDGQTFFKDVVIRSTSAIAFQELKGLVADWDPASISAGTKDKTIFLPITKASGREHLGYFILQGVKHPSVPTAAVDVSRLAAKVSRHLGFCLQYWEAVNLSLVDDLTGLFNQKYMSMVLESEIHRATRLDKKFSVLFMDIDFFKTVNDTKGHWIGSKLLVELGHILRDCVRRSDYTFRYGGDEFVMVLPDTESAGALIVAERVRRAVEQSEFLIDGMRIQVTISIGIATYPDHAQSHKEIIKMADQAMYCGKNKSRNVVFMAS
jgi:diguanylate cyclase (GGDEF)-like protein